MEGLKYGTLSNLTVDMRYQVASKARLSDLAKLCRTNKAWAEICRVDTLWKRKILVDFPEYFQKKPDYLSYKQWYKKLYKSGDLYLYNDIENTQKFIASDVTKAFPYSSNGIFYIDIFGDLYLFTEYPDILLDDTFTDFPNSWKEKLNEHTGIQNKNYLLEEDVKDIYIGENVLLLDRKGIIYKYEEKWISYMENVKKIINVEDGQEDCLILDKTDKLYYYNEKEIKFIVDNVKSANFGRFFNEFSNFQPIEMEALIFYVTLDDQGYVAVPMLAPKIIDPSSTESSHVKYVNFKLFEKDVKSIHVSANDIVMVDKHSKLYFYSKSSFSNTTINVESTVYPDYVSNVQTNGNVSIGIITRQNILYYGGIDEELHYIQKDANNLFLGLDLAYTSLRPPFKNTPSVDWDAFK